MLFASSTQALRPNTTINPCPSRISLPAFEAFAGSVWNKHRWERGAPKPKTIAAAQQLIYCSKGSGERGRFKRRWEVLRGAYFDHRSVMLWRERVTPFYGCTTFSCGWYAIPTQYVDCESGGRGGPYPNIYGIISPTWGNYGGYAYAGSAESATFREQSLIAKAIWDDVGSAAWAPFEGGCSWQ